MKWLLVLCLVGCLLAGCTDAELAQQNSYGKPQRVTLYGASGAAIRTWKSTGKVLTENQSDRWYFQDAATHTLVRVSGTVVIEKAD